MPQSILKQRIIAAAEAGFLAPDEKQNVVEQLKKDLTAGGVEL